MAELTVENMFVERSFTSVEIVPDMALGTPNRKRILELVIAKVTSEVLSAPGANPVGLTVTVTAEKDDSLSVVATAPQYCLNDKFFS